jgi:hypothetical protein
MKKKRQNNLIDQKWKKFIELMIPVTNGDEMIAAYRAVYPQAKNREGARTGAYKLLQNPNISKAIEEGRRELEEQVKQAQKEERIRLAKEQVASEHELDAQMSKMALGQLTMKRKQVVKLAEDKYEIVEIEEGPSENGMVAAAAQLYKRKGSYAPVGIKHDASDPLMEIMKAVAQVGNKNIPNDIEPRADTEEV